MPDVEKVIKGLECCLGSDSCAKCNFFEYKMDCSWHLKYEALELLKAQEPVKPTLDIRHGKSMWRCGTCSTALQPNQMHAKFCFNCGRAVKWE